MISLENSTAIVNVICLNQVLKQFSKYSVLKINENDSEVWTDIKKLLISCSRFH